MYGRLWLDTWAGVGMDEVRTVWAQDLSGFDGDSLRRALDHCKANNKFPPTCPEFAGLCRAFNPSPTGRVNALPAPRGGYIAPEIMSEIAKLLEAGRKRDPKDWARSILKEAKDGTYRHPHGIHCAKEALGIAA